jgi:uncharacterized membrane protein YhaH (DUF805 family)
MNMNRMFSLTGRANRAEYWMNWFVITFAFTVLLVVLAKLRVSNGIIIILIALTSLAYLPTSIRRLHDRNKSGWWVIVFIFTPMIFSLFIDQDTSNPQTVFLGLVGFGIMLWAFTELCCLKGTAGDNRFGPDPLHAKPAQPVAVAAPATAATARDTELTELRERLARLERVSTSVKNPIENVI